MKQYRGLKDSIEKCKFFLGNIEKDIAQFEKAIANTTKQLEQISSEIERITAYNDRKILQFVPKGDKDVK